MTTSYSEQVKAASSGATTSKLLQILTEVQSELKQLPESQVPNMETQIIGFFTALRDHSPAVYEAFVKKSGIPHMHNAAEWHSGKTPYWFGGEIQSNLPSKSFLTFYLQQVADLLEIK